MEKNTLNYLIVDKMEKIDEKLAALEKESKEIESRFDKANEDAILAEMKSKIDFLETTLSYCFLFISANLFVQMLLCFLQL